MKIQYSLLICLSLTSTLLAQTTKIPDTLPLFGKVNKGAEGAQAPSAPQVDPKTGKKLYLREDLRKYLTPKGNYKPSKATVISLLGRPDSTSTNEDEMEEWTYNYRAIDPISKKLDLFFLIVFDARLNKKDPIVFAAQFQ